MLSNDSDAESPIKVQEERPGRSKKLLVKLRDVLMELDELVPVTKRELYTKILLYGDHTVVFCKCRLAS